MSKGIRISLTTWKALNKIGAQLVVEEELEKGTHDNTIQWLIKDADVDVDDPILGE